ncbi:MAG: thioredoxin fold domain-containing protein, partial [gamma proteobacterium symbiont of Phacoides pectinatus]
MTEITKVTDLAADARHGLPILLLVSQDHCPFCVQIKRDILHPMLLAGDYRGQILIRELYIDPGVSVLDFEGQRIPAIDYAHGLGVNLTPTLLFLDPRGKELAERIIGINTPEMFYFQVCRYLVKDFGTSQSPKSTRQRDSRYCPD